MTTTSAAPSCPFVGLQPFTEADADYFFGRGRDRRVIVANLYAAPLTVLYGASGVGKSSILLAGVVPDLRAKPRTAVVVFRDWQGAAFLETLKAKCLSAVSEASGKSLAIDGKLAFDDFLATAATAFKGAITLIFDQFEEYFLYHPASETDSAFEVEFARAINRDDVEASFLLAVREDELAKLDRFRARIPNLLANTLRLKHLTAADAERAIRRPLDVFNQRHADPAKAVVIEDELVGAVIAQVRAGQALLSRSGGVGLAEAGDEAARIEAPFLQLVMTRLWEEETRTGSRTLRFATLERLGGAQQIVASHLDSVMARLDATEQEVCSRFFDRLVTPSGSKIACSADDLTKWAGELATHVPAVLKTLSDSRLLRGVAVASGGGPQAQCFEIFHDVLAPAVLSWRTRYVEGRKRTEAERRAEAQAKVARRLRLTVAVLALLCLFLVGGGVFIWYAYERDYAAYYNAFVKRWGEPAGYGKLTAEQVRQRPWSLKVVTHGRRGLVEYMEAVNNRDQCMPEHTVGRYLEYDTQQGPIAELKTTALRECKWVFVRDGDGNVIYEKAYNKRGDLVWGLAYAPSTEPKQHRQAYFVGPDGSLSLQLVKNTRLHSVEIEYSELGYEIRRKYWSYSGGEKHPETGKDHAYGEYREYNTNGLPTLLASLGKDQASWMNNTAGSAVKRLRYDPLGNVVEVAAFDRDNVPVRLSTGIGEGGYHKRQTEYDKNGNGISDKYFDTDGRPMIRHGHYEARVKYDNGNAVAAAFFDIDGRPATSDELGAHKMTIKYDNGRITETRFYDQKGHPALAVSGVHLGRPSYDSDGNTTSVEYFDALEQPARNVLGIHRIQWQFDERGNIIGESWFDENNRRTHPTVDIDMGIIHVSKAAYGVNVAYDNHHNRTSITLVDEAGRPVSGSNGFAAIHYVYDDRGNNTEEEYLDVEERPVRLLGKGYAQIHRDYDDRGNIVREEYRDEKGALVIAGDGYAAIERQFDERDRVIEEAYFGTDKTLIQRPDGYAVVRKKFDRRDLAIEEAYFGADEKLLVQPKGYAILRKKYNDRGDFIEDAYFGADEKPLVQSEGYAMGRVKYDDRGNVIEIAFFGADEKLLVQPKGYAMIRWKHDNRGNVIEEAYFGADEKLLVQPKGYAMIFRKHDDRGNVIEEAYFGADEKLLVQPKGYAMVRRKHDDRGNVIEEAYFGADEKLLVQPEGYAMVRRKHDNRGNVIEEAYFGADEKLLVQPKGYAMVRKKYDDYGHETEEFYFDPTDKPVCHDASYAIYCKIMYEYDQSGLRKTASYTDLDGRPPLITITYSYDAAGKLIGAGSVGKNGEALTYRELVLATIPSLQAEHLLLPGDIILRYAGTEIDSPESLHTEDTSGGPRELVICRDGKLITLQAQPGRLGFWDQPAFEISSHAPATASH